MNVEWDIPIDLISDDLGALSFNDDSYAGSPFSSGPFMFTLDHEKCSMIHEPARNETAEDPLPQGDGAIIHKKFKPGVHVHLTVELWSSREAVAVGADRRVMAETLDAWCDALWNTDGRLQWTPSGYSDDRILDFVRVFEWPVYADQGDLCVATIVLHTRFPYAIDLTEQDVTLSGSTVVHNAGNTDFSPVYQIDGPVSEFFLGDGTDEIHYDSTQPGAVAIPSGAYIEIDTFRDTAYGFGGAFGSVGVNLKPGIDLVNSTFFKIHPDARQPGGSTTLTLAGTTGLAKINNAWA